MALEGWTVKKVERKDITNFIETWHYSKSINGCIADYCYALYDANNVMKGAMFYGRLAMANQWKKFHSDPTKVIELRRLCCVDDTPKNTESFFIGKSIRMLKEEWDGEVIVSYADLEYGHEGTIYKATNFFDDGRVNGAKVIMDGEKRYHDKAIRTKYKGELKPFAKRLKERLENGQAFYKKTKGKVRYIYFLTRKGRKQYLKDRK